MPAPSFPSFHQRRPEGRHPRLQGLSRQTLVRFPKLPFIPSDHHLPIQYLGTRHRTIFRTSHKSVDFGFQARTPPGAPPHLQQPSIALGWAVAHVVATSGVLGAHLASQAEAVERAATRSPRPCQDALASRRPCPAGARPPDAVHERREGEGVGPCIPRTPGHGAPPLPKLCVRFRSRPCPTSPGPPLPKRFVGFRPRPCPAEGTPGPPLPKLPGTRAPKPYHRTRVE